MAKLYQPFINLPPLDLAQLAADLRELAGMRSIEGEHPELATRQQAGAIVAAVTPYILYFGAAPHEKQIDHVLQRIKSACQFVALSESEQWRDFGTYHPAANGDDLQGIADRLAEAASCGDASDEAGDTSRPEIISSIGDDPLLTHVDLAKRFNLNRDVTRKKLDRWRSANGAGWIEATDIRPNEPKYLYRLSAVRNLFKASEGASGETSG